MEPLPVETAGMDFLQNLCSSCQRLNASLAARETDPDQIPRRGWQVLSLPVGKRPQNSSCDFVDSSSTWHQLLADNTDYMSDYSIDVGFIHSTQFVWESFRAGVVAHIPATDLSSPIVRSIEPAAIDWGSLNCWISHCQSSHAECTKADPRSDGLPYLYLIDCVQGLVVRVKRKRNISNAQLRLGPQTRRKAPVEGSWPEGSFSVLDALLTIQDAIRVVRELSLRYLWVDKYCINQADVEEKRLILRNMDQIYEHATATIVAIHGDNDKAGLPDVSTVLRKPQPQVQTQGVVQNSTWATPGWTYQESRLSCRCLFFTENQVYHVCKKTTRSEVIAQEGDSCWISFGLNAAGLNAALYAGENTMSTDFIHDRFAFSKRQLTKESDILDAFRGILNRSPFVTFWGLPIKLRNSKLNAHAEQDKDAPQRRRPGFPSWIWTSVVGEIFNLGRGHQSVLGSYLSGEADVNTNGESPIHIWLSLQHNWVSLDKIVELCRSNVLPEEAVILLYWNDYQKAKKRRFILMLLVWIEDGVAQRKGILGDYRSEYDADVLEKVPKYRRTFILT
ncbi:HET-domain-containing protein [Triangularia setosa]|uniref:HET-domain-containing protein n=1 Tax=Triangularia setosa TaxID=2587417 RepID=A0AAN6WA05_9PEZI|nr:HET-domain-containing protein [Podospora setosa]